MSSDLLLEIGVEELPASFVEAAIAALPELVAAELGRLRLSHGEVTATGTPRRLALLVVGLADRQPDLDEEVLGPPARVGLDAAGKPTKAAEAFAKKLGCELSALETRETDKGSYLIGRRKELGAPAADLLPDALARVAAAIPFRKSMRWGELEQPFGRPIRWLVALHGAAIVPVAFAGVVAGRVTYGHRFRNPEPIELSDSAAYVGALRAANVLVSMEERKRTMLERLRAACAELGGQLIEDEGLVVENASLVEDPQIIVGSFDPSFLDLPERVILQVAKGHQFYFGARGPDGALLPRYLAVVNTALRPENVRRGNDRVMRARLSDARFFWDEDRKRPLADRRAALDGIVFHKRLGTVGDKVRRLEALVATLADAVGVDAATRQVALDGAALAKCDLVSLMVGEFPELQGRMGRAYALSDGLSPEVAEVIEQHYAPRGADDPTAPSDAAALVALADRLDTLVGCFAVGLVPTGAADPLALRRAAIGAQRTLLERAWALSLSAAIDAAWAGFAGVRLDQTLEETRKKLLEFAALRLRGVLAAEWPADVVDACMAAGADRPADVRLRVAALSAIEPDTRALTGEVWKRAANIAKEAPAGAPVDPATLSADVHASEARVWEGFGALARTLDEASARGDYRASLGAIAEFAPVLARFFEDVFVMTDDLPVRENRLRLMRDLHGRCSSLADFNLLARQR